jgi:RimJ/RimL family protein N-acetyltransferase
LPSTELTPVIETERLILRGHRLSDFDAHAALWADPGVVRFISGKPSTREESWGRMMRYPGMWSLVGYGFWLFEEKATGAFIGEGGFGAFKRDIDPPFDAPEQGWALAPAAHGKGYAREAMQAALTWGEQRFGRRDFVCMIAPENAPSLKLAGKLGYREYGRTSYKGEPSILLRRI